MIHASRKAEFPRSTTAKLVAQIAIVFIAYFVAGKIGQSTANIRSGNLGPVWPAYGIALAAFLLYGYRVWIGVAAGAFVVALWSPVPVIAAVGQATGATLASLTGAFLLRRMHFNTALARLHDVLALIAVGAFGSTLVSATIGTLVLYFTHVQAYSGIRSAWLIYWLGDATGALLVTPLVLTFPTLFRIHRGKVWMEFAALFALLTAAAYVMFSENNPIPANLDIMAFVVLPFVMWAAVRFGVNGSALATFIIAAIATVQTACGCGPFARGTPFVNAVLLDVFFTALAAPGMALAAVIAERRSAQAERERLVREQAAMEAKLRLATIVESSEDAIIGLDLDGTITDWNKSAETLYGYSREEVIGKPASRLIPPERQGDCHNIRGKLKQGVAVTHHETVRRKKDGTYLEVSLTGSPIFGADGQVVGISSIERDISELKRQQEVLRKSEELFRLAAQAGKMVAYEWDVPSDVVMRSGEAGSIIGIDHSTRLSREQILALVHPQDRKKIDAATAALSPEKPHLMISHRILRPDNQVRWVDRYAVGHFDEQGRLQRMVGMVVDVTERKQVEEALASARRRLIEAQEEERRRIARELHDDIGQRLTLLTVQLEQLQRSASSINGEYGVRLNDLRQQALEMGIDIQSLSHQLHSARLEYLGIGTAAVGFCREFGEKHNVEIDCSVQNLPDHLERTNAISLFRVLQEALQNSLKYSGVKRFEVRLWATPQQVHLSVSDCGTGFDMEMAKDRGLGLISMEERMKLVNGEFSVESHPDRGTTIHAAVPLTLESQPARAAG